MNLRRTAILICMLITIGINSYADTLPPTFLLKPAVLMAVKEKVRQHDTQLQQALAGWLADADKALQKGPYSVVYKEKVPPSGNKHDYMSVGPYWWPDSSKPNGLPYIRKDGQINPERYAIKDDEYFNALCRDVSLLGTAWFYTGNEKYADHAAKLLRTWFTDTATRMNPHLNYGQAIPGITEGRNIGIIDTHNTAVLIDGIQLLKGSPALSEADYRGIQAWYKQFLDWMLHSPIGKDEADEHNNHGTWYDVQAVSIALFTEQPALAEKILKEQTEKRIESQLKPDGSQPFELARTLSWNYSLMNLKGFFELAMLAENVHIDLWKYESPGGKSLKKAFSWMLPYAEGKGTWAFKQIKPADKNGYLELAWVAGKKYTDIDLTPLWEKYTGFKNNELLLTGWKL